MDTWLVLFYFREEKFSLRRDLKAFVACVWVSNFS